MRRALFPRRAAALRALLRPASRSAAASPAASAAAGAPPPPPRAAPPPAPAPKYATLPEGQRRQVDAYLDALLDWNSRMNLTATRDRAEAVSRHVDDSLALLPALDACVAAQAAARARVGAVGAGARAGGSASNNQEGWDAWLAGAPPARPPPAGAADAGYDASAAPPGVPPRPVSLVDVGSGAGLPGLILAIARPAWRVTLLDSLNKRCAFLEAAAAAAGAANVAVACARAEDAGASGSPLREAADLATARAVAELRVLAELCLPLVAPGGHFVAAKGAEWAEEAAAARGALGTLGGRLLRVEAVDSPAAGGGFRTAAVVAKRGPTPAHLPRRAGTPKKSPLL
jgi:16S rRNA (guanine(527)-N(7))-methyltransferase RsmG